MNEPVENMLHWLANLRDRYTDAASYWASVDDQWRQDISAAHAAAYRRAHDHLQHTESQPPRSDP